MNEQEKTTGPFVLFRNAIGVISILDTRRKEDGDRGAIAIFFHDEKHPARTARYAQFCADALNSEVARQTHKE